MLTCSFIAPPFHYPSSTFDCLSLGCKITFLVLNVVVAYAVNVMPKSTTGASIKVIKHGYLLYIVE